MINAATNMVIATGIAANLVLNPMITNIGANTSDISVRINDIVGLTPSGSGKADGSANIFNFGMPCVSIIPEKPMRKIAKAKSVKFFVILFLFFIGLIYKKLL